MAQDVKPATATQKPVVHRMQLFNGPVASVTYFGNGLSEGDRSSLSTLEQSENALGAEIALGSRLARLKEQYIADEQVTEQRRRQAQNVMYNNAAGATPLYTRLFFPAEMFPEEAGRFPLRAAAPGLGAYSFMSSFPTPVSAAWNWNGYGATHEGPIKVDAAAAMTQPESASQAVRNYDAAVARAGASRDLGPALALQPTAGKSGVVPAAAETTKGGKRVTLTVKSGNSTEKIEGTFVGREGDWLLLDTANGRERVRESEVTRMIEPKE